MWLLVTLNRFWKTSCIFINTSLLKLNVHFFVTSQVLIYIKQSGLYFSQRIWKGCFYNLVSGLGKVIYFFISYQVLFTCMMIHSIFSCMHVCIQYLLEYVELPYFLICIGFYSWHLLYASWTMVVLANLGRCAKRKITTYGSALMVS